MTSSPNPAISVIIPVRNSGRYFRECLDSVLRQTLQNIEVIIIDDASTDGSGDVADAYAIQYSQLTVIHHKESTGAGPARNDGMAVARGEYIAFMDSDDLYPVDDVLETLYRTAVEKKADICGGSLYKIDADGNILDMKVPDQYFEKEGWIQYRDYQYDGGFYRFLYRKIFLEENNIDFPAYRRFQDPVFFVKSMIRSEWFYVLPLYVYAYRKGHKNIIWTYENVKNHLYGIRDLISISKIYNLKRLHYLMAKNLLDTINHKASHIVKFLLIFDIIKYIKHIDWNIIKEENAKHNVHISISKILYMFFFK